MNAIIGTFSFTLFVSIFHIDAVNVSNLIYYGVIK